MSDIIVYKNRKQIFKEMSQGVKTTTDKREWHPARPIGFYYGFIARIKFAYQVFKGQWDLVGKRWDIWDELNPNYEDSEMRCTVHDKKRKVWKGRLLDKVGDKLNVLFDDGHAEWVKSKYIKAG